MTVRDVATLKANMPIGVAGGTTVQDIHDIVDTFDSLIAGVNTGGGSTTTGSTPFWTPQDSGVIEGGGKTAQQRIDNGIAFQAAIDAANAQRKILVVPRGTYEISLVNGLECPHYGFRWLGTRNSHIVQFADNTPIITFGKKDTASTVETAAQQVDGVSVFYGNVQPDTNTAANAVIFSRVWGSEYKNFEIGSINQQRANATLMFRGVFITNGFFFSNTLTNFRIKHWNHQGFRWAVQGTGNVFNNIYLSNGNLGQTIGTVTSCLSLNASGSTMQESVWNQLNLEWSNVFIGIDMNNARNQIFNSLHCEGLSPRDNGSGYFKFNSASSAVFNGLTLLNCQSAGDCSIFGLGWESNVVVNLATLENFNNTSLRTMSLVSADTGTVRNANIKIVSIRLGNNVNIAQSDTTALDTGGGSDQSRPLKELGNVLPMAAGVSTLGDVNFVASGRALRHTIRYATPLTVDRSLTLTSRYDASGVSGNQMTLPNGPTHRIIRAAAATGAFNLTVNSSTAADGTTPTALGTLAPGEFMDVLFNGTSWIVMMRGTETPVASASGNDVIAKTASYAPTAAETGKYFTINVATANTFTVPADAPVGWESAVMQVGVGQTTVAVAGTGVLRHPDGHTKISKQYGLIYLKVYENAGTAPQVAFTGDTAA